VVPAGDVWVAELFHGSTAAFKDMALQLLPHLMTASLRQCGDARRALILAATSGDTGKAALAGFADVEGTMIKVFYPQDGVSPVQQRQMTTQTGHNVDVVALHGNFDDAQRAVKEAFASPELAQACSDKGIFLTSANSINIGRLLPQIVYYFHAYLTLAARGVLTLGDVIDFVVPSGNFGNCLAGVMARRMGLPVRRFIVASNRNKVLTDFFQTGCYDIRRPFHKTNAPAMDILVSSNLERLLCMLGGDATQTARLMQALATEGVYRISDTQFQSLRSLFAAGWQDEQEVLNTIRRCYRATGYLADTHTAVALGVAEQYQIKGDTTPTVVLSTASPYKFPASVCQAILGKALPDAEAMEALHEATGVPVPACLADVMTRPVLHTGIANPADIINYIKENLN
jgi:threonine synthase